MRQGHSPPETSIVVELPVPVVARIHRVRRRKDERVILVVRAPASLPCLEADMAPVVATIALPPVRPRSYWPVFGRSGSLAFIRHDGKRFWRPVAGHGTGGPVTVEDLSPRIRGWASGDEAWSEWPYAIDRRRSGAGRLPVVEFEGLALLSCSVNPLVKHADEAARLAESLCLIDGMLYARCSEPVIDVVVQGLGKGSATSISVVPSAGAQLDSEVEADVVQTFSGGDPGDAEAYAAEIAAATGLPIHGSARWFVTGAVLNRQDARDAPSEGLARIAARTHRLVGRLPRPSAETWLDLRDAGEGLVDAAEAVSLCRRLIALLPSAEGLLPMLLRWEILRWEGSIPDDDASALGGLA